MAQDAALTKRQAEKVVEALIPSSQEGLRQGEHVTLVGFGTLAVASRGARKGGHPRTGQEMWLPARRRPTFSVGNGLREVVK
jgi:DNA-binding protein HU-beta